MKIWGTLGAGVILVACAANEMPAPSEGAAVFASNCVSCHGTSARGDGPLANDLSPRPTDLTRISARNGGVFPRAQTLSVIDGYSKGTHKDRAMPEFGAQMTGEDTVPVEVDGILTPTPRSLAALLAYLESIQS